MLISYGSLGLGAANNSAVVNESSTHKCAFLSVRDNFAAFAHQQPNARYLGGLCPLCRSDQHRFPSQASHGFQELTIYIPAGLTLRQEKQHTLRLVKVLRCRSPGNLWGHCPRARSVPGARHSLGASGSVLQRASEDSAGWRSELPDKHCC